jgi:hypothetical protein
MISKLIEERNNNNNIKDRQIRELKIANHEIKQDQIKQENLIEALRKEVGLVQI